MWANDLEARMAQGIGDRPLRSLEQESVARLERTVTAEEVCGTIDDDGCGSGHAHMTFDQDDTRALTRRTANELAGTQGDIGGIREKRRLCGVTSGLIESVL